MNHGYTGGITKEVGGSRSSKGRSLITIQTILLQWTEQEREVMDTLTTSVQNSRAPRLRKRGLQRRKREQHYDYVQRTERELRDTRA